MFRQPLQIPSIRKATLQNAADIATIAHQTYLETYGSHLKDKANKLYGNNFIGNIYPQWMTEKNIVAIVRLGNKPIGFAKLSLTDDGIALLDKLYILKLYHRHGFGKQLLRFCYNQALDRGYTKAKLLVYEKNTGAIAFYKACGFKHTAQRECYLLPSGEHSGILNDVMYCDDIKGKLVRPISEPRP